jgi:hypothetical protein
MGHNFGMEHDEQNCDCPEAYCLMAASDKTFLQLDFSWSSCSVHQLKNFLTDKDASCLMNRPKALMNKAFCGNGFVEEGEECDCGLPKYCKNKCCNSYTCKLTANSKCAHGDCCNKETCDFREKGKKFNNFFKHEQT